MRSEAIFAAVSKILGRRTNTISREPSPTNDPAQIHAHTPPCICGCRGAKLIEYRSAVRKNAEQTKRIQDVAGPSRDCAQNGPGITGIETLHPLDIDQTQEANAGRHNDEPPEERKAHIQSPPLGKVDTEQQKAKRAE